MEYKGWLGIFWIVPQLVRAEVLHHEPSPACEVMGLDELRTYCLSLPRMLFIVSSNVDKTDPVTRRCIRSHVMRGKKQKRNRPRMNERTSDGEITARPPRVTPIKMEEVIETYTPLPGRVGSDLSFIEFADSIEPSLVLHIAKFSTVATRVIFPLMAVIGFQTPNKDSLRSIAADAAFLHITAFAVEEFFHRIFHHHENGSNPTSILHFTTGIKILRERLSGDDEEAKLSDSTISVVLKLASTAHFDGDSQTSAQHMEGLRRIVDLRGGLDGFKNRKLLMEILRCDLSIALLNGFDPIFSREPSRPVISYPKELLVASKNHTSFEAQIQFAGPLDGDLETAWRVMRRFCLLANLGTEIQRPIYPEIIQETMASVIYHLLHMEFSAGCLNESVRLGLLAFCHHIFLQWQDIKPLSSLFSITYRSCIMNLRAVDGVSSQLMLWLLMTGAVSFFDISAEAWLGESLRKHASSCEVKTWNEMQEVLKSFMWIVSLDSHLGKQVYDGLYVDEE